MSEPFTLDVCAFEKLLEAAWVIQSQQPPELSDPDQGHANSLQHDSILNPRQDAFTAVERAEAETAPVGEVELVYVQRGHEVSSVRAIRSPHKLRFAIASWEPVLVLLVIAVFFLFEVSSHDRHSQAVLFTASASTRIEGCMSQQAVSQPFVPQANPTHLQITDPETAFTVENLSPYEIKALQRQARYGDDSAALTLAMAYETGHLVPQSCAKAAAWVMAAATEGNAAAQYNLGLRYLYGDGLPMSSPDAQRWLRESSAKGTGKGEAVP